ncbi:hypothetical protein A5761_01700 [Mycolicibacterium setense]|nr:hypothetical protein A5761_01700 [Mycolicibacterium setense]
MAPAAQTFVIDGKVYLRASLRLVQRCPARADYVELVLETEEGPWHWCVPEPPGRAGDCGVPVTLALTLGRYAVQAHEVQGDEKDRRGFALPSATAAPLIISGAQVYLERDLIGRSH